MKNDFRSWREPVPQRCALFGRYRGRVGHGADSPIQSRMTHKRSISFGDEEVRSTTDILVSAKTDHYSFCYIPFQQVAAFSARSKEMATTTAALS